MKTLLIGGAPCAGKSFVAKELAERFNTTWKSTDELRDHFRDNPNRLGHHYPYLFASKDVTAEEFWKNRKPIDVLRGEVEEARELWPWLQKVVEKNSYGILEGVSILPELVRKTYGTSKTALFLIDTDRERVRQIIQTRGLWDEAHTYADWIKPLELEWVMLHTAWLRSETQRYGFPLIEVGNRSALMQRVMASLPLSTD